MNKYGAKKHLVNGILFDSGREARRYVDLVILARAGEIFDLELQPVFELAPAVVLDGRRKPALRYRADFRYRTGSPSNWRWVVEDAKGVKTTVYRLKKHLMMSVHGIEVEEV